MSKHIHILGICGTFMGSIAVLARQLGYTVTGCDANVYPPMSTYLEAQGIEIVPGFDAEQLAQFPADEFIIGNVMSRGKPVLEALLNQRLPYYSGPAWLAQNVLQDKKVIVVAGTHGKTTTSSMLAWILEYAGRSPGFLIGGITENFGVSSRVTDSDWFVVEGDEYDTAFCDKRSKFVHYRPHIALLNNLEFDHADIFPDISAIQTQFHHLVRIVPEQGWVVSNQDAPYLEEVLAQGCWSQQSHFGAHAAWQAQSIATDHSAFSVWHEGLQVGEIDYDLMGEHNQQNALAAIATANAAGVDVATSCAALANFKNAKRRMEHRGEVNGICVYDDFAHHPTAIRLTLEGMQKRVNGEGRVFAVLEPRSNTMRMNYHGHALRDALQYCDQGFVYQAPSLTWELDATLAGSEVPLSVYKDFDALVEAICLYAEPGDHIVVMSNGGFGNIHQKLLSALANKSVIA